MLDIDLYESIMMLRYEVLEPQIQLYTVHNHMYLVLHTRYIIGLLIDHENPDLNGS